MHDLFGTEGMTAFTVAFFVLHLLSFLFLIVICHEFLIVERTYTNLISVLRQEGGAKKVKRFTLLWVYVVSTIIIFVVSAVLLVFQPHLL